MHARIRRARTATTGSCGAWKRQRKAEGRALARRALQPDFAAVQLDQALRERQAEPRAFRLARGIAADLPEFLKNRALLLGCDADAAVAHRDLDRAVEPARRELDAPAVGRELDRVRQ